MGGTLLAVSGHMLNTPVLILPYSVINPYSALQSEKKQAPVLIPKIQYNKRYKGRLKKGNAGTNRTKYIVIQLDKDRMCKSGLTIDTTFGDM